MLSKSDKNKQNNLKDHFPEILGLLSKDEINQFIKIRRLSTGEIDEGSMRSIKAEYINRFILFDFISPTNNYYYLTSTGEIVYNLLRENK